MHSTDEIADYLARVERSLEHYATTYNDPRIEEHDKTFLRGMIEALKWVLRPQDHDDRENRPN